jgi:hypothetical protein
MSQISSAVGSPSESPKTQRAERGVGPERERGVEVLDADRRRAVQQRVKQRQADGMRFGAGGGSAPEAGVAVRELVVDGDPLRACIVVEGEECLLLAGEQNGSGKLTADLHEVLVAQGAAEGQLLAALDGDQHEAVVMPTSA